MLLCLTVSNISDYELALAFVGREYFILPPRLKTGEAAYKEQTVTRVVDLIQETS